MVIILAIFLLLAAIMLPLSRDISTVRRFRAAATDRQLAESVMNELFTLSSRSSVIPEMTLPGRVDPGRDVADAGTFRGWGEFVISASGVPTYQRCGIAAGVSDTGTNKSLKGTSCYFYSLLEQSGLVTVEVTTRSGCSDNGRNCVFKRYQQRWKRRSFLDYVIFTDQETIAPSLYPELEADGWPVTRFGSTRNVYRQWAIDRCANIQTETAPNTFVPATPAAGSLDSHRRQHLTDGLWSPYTPAGVLKTGADALQPAGLRHEDCYDIAYTGGTGSGAVGDIVDGPIKTNDPYFWYCGSPEFRQKVYATGNGTPATPLSGGEANWTNFFKRSVQTGCASVAASGEGVRGPALSSGPDVEQREHDLIPSSLSDYWRFAAFKRVGDTTITLGTNGAAPNNSATIGTDPVTLPTRSLVFVQGDLNLSTSTGVTNGVTFMSTGDVTITGNILGSDIGIIAQGAVRIQKNTAADVNIQASLMAVDEAVYVTGWDEDAGADKRTVNLTGSVVGRYRPVFGGYSGTGVLRTGMLKNIVYPTPRPNPPYFLQPVNASWERIDLTEIQFGKSQDPGPAKVGLTPPPNTLGSAFVSSLGGSCVGPSGAEPSSYAYTEVGSAGQTTTITVGHQLACLTNPAL